MSHPNVTEVDGKLKYREDAPATDFEAFKTVAYSRRSVRVFDGTPIPEPILKECFEIALRAPNSSNLQPWEFYRVKTPETKAALAIACQGQQAARTAAELIVCVARTNTWPKHSLGMTELIEGALPPGLTVPAIVSEYYNRKTFLMYRMGPLGIYGVFRRLIVWIRGFREVMPREPHDRRQLALWAVKSTALACENLMLAFRAAGFDSCPMEGFDGVRVARLLKLPRDAQIVMVIGAGRRAINGVYNPPVRYPMEEFIKEV